MSIYKNKKTGCWHIDYRANGRRIREKVGPSKRIAENALAKRKAEIAEGRFFDMKHQSRSKFYEAAERFLSYSKANKKSYRRDEGIVRIYLVPAFGKKRLDTVTSWDIEKYKARRKELASAATVNRELACMKTIFNKAIQWGMASSNPVKGVALMPENNRRVRFLMHEEIHPLLHACPTYLQPIVHIALNTGMRLGEILSLTWADIDFRRQQVTVRDSKNGESRIIEMNSTLRETLQGMKRSTAYPHVCLGQSGKPVTTVRKAFMKACKAAAIEDFRFHDLRHTFASHLVMNGTDLTTVKELLGHKSIEMTLRYAHLSQPHRKNAVEELGRALDGHFLDTQDNRVVTARFGEVSK